MKAMFLDIFLVPGGVTPTEPICQFETKEPAGTIIGESQQPAVLQDNPAYFTVRSTHKQMLKNSEIIAYDTVDEAQHQLTLQYNPAYFNANRSVSSSSVSVGKSMIMFGLCFDNVSALLARFTCIGDADSVL